MFEVVALGELLIDFTPAGVSSAGNGLFERNPGGAPANVLAAVSKLGGNSAFIGKVGRDQFGHYLKEVLDQNRIETRALKFSDEYNTTLAFVHLNEKGDRSFSFYRNPGADTRLEEGDIDYSLIDEARVFHFGSLSMTHEPSKSATIKAVEYAKKQGKIISYDPNWRPPLWRGEKDAKDGMLIGLKYADIVKISEEEHEFLTGEKDLPTGCRELIKRGIKLVIVTLGPKGCFYCFKGGSGYLSTYDTKVVDTTGSGDAFLGAFLFSLGKYEIDINEMNIRKLEAALDFSNAVGALCASKRGAIPGMPTYEEAVECVSSVPRLEM